MTAVIERSAPGIGPAGAQAPLPRKALRPNPAAPARRRFVEPQTLFLLAYLIFALLPIYWMVNMSFKTNNEIVSSFTVFPRAFTWENYRTIFTDAWLTVLLMDVWHWTPLVALLAYAGLRSIPDAYYQAARIDGASKLAVLRYIQLPKLRGVLMIAVLLRFMDSFMIYTEPFVLTGGGPGNATTFLSQYLTQKAVGQFDLGPAAAFSLIYFLIILLLCFVLYNWMQRVGTADKEQGHE
jgi:ABC-type sugar transport system permease subunit